MKPGSIFKLVQELKRRRVFRGIVVYGASTLILLEAANNIANSFGLDAAPPWFVLLLGIGFLGSLWFSWIYDITPGGIKKTEPASELSVPISKKEVRTYQTTTFVSVMIVIGLLTYNIIDGTRKRKIAHIEKSIAVLPFNGKVLSQTEITNYEFIGAEITSCLLKVEDYRVVPWEDCRKYKRGDKPYPEIGKDLSAAILVDWTPYETTIRKNLSVNLISANDASLLWSENFEVEFDWPTEICRHSRKISKRITRKLRTYLSPQERALLSEEPASARATMYASLGSAMTQDAWELIQTGGSSFDIEKNNYSDSISFEKAIRYFTEAIKEDTTFAQAYANRAKAKLFGIRAGYYDHSLLEECEQDIRRAFKLQPDLPEAHIAMGFYYYYGLGEYEWALISFEKAADFRPDKSEYLYYLSIINRALGNWERVQVLSDNVFYSNPRNALFLTNLGFSYLYLGNISRSVTCFERAIELLPTWFIPYLYMIKAHIYTGNIPGARKIAKEAKNKTGIDFYRILAELDLYEGKFLQAVENIEMADEMEFYELRETEGDACLLKAKIHKHAGNVSKALDNYELAAAYFNNRVLFDPEDAYSHGKLGLAYAGMGMKEKAVNHIYKALELIENQIDAITDPYILYDIIQTYAIIGDHEAGLNMIEELLDRKSLFSLESLKLDPDLRPLLMDPVSEFFKP